MFHSSDILSLFEPAVGAAEPGRYLYEILLKPTHPSSGDPSRSPLLLRVLEEGQAEGGYQLEGMIHWPAGLLVRVRLPNSRGLGRLVAFICARTAPPDCGQGYWEDEPASIRLIQPEAENRPVNTFTHQMDRIRLALDPSPFHPVGLFYYHKAFREKILPAA